MENAIEGTMLSLIQKGMYAMIGTSIMLAIWTSGLLFLTAKSEKKRLVEGQTQVGDEKGFEVETTTVAKS